MTLYVDMGRLLRDGLLSLSGFQGLVAHLGGAAVYCLLLRVSSPSQRIGPGFWSFPHPHLVALSAFRAWGPGGSGAEGGVKAPIRGLCLGGIDFFRVSASTVEFKVSDI